MQPLLKNITFDEVNTSLISNKNISLTVARLDKIHHTISGNKLFKLHYFIRECLNTTHKTLITFGGAYSNHLAATAYLCNQKNIKCIAVVRGEKPETLSPTLQNCLQLGMQLKFISRAHYAHINNTSNYNELISEFGEFTLVPEGGFSTNGAMGAALIMDLIPKNKYTHVVTCVGTATTLAGLLIGKEDTQNVIGIPAIKNMTDIGERLKILKVPQTKTPTIFNEYHFGGYAKYNTELLLFMNQFYKATGIPTDFVYTAKMMYGIIDKIKQDYFAANSNILCLHTGGLQGNQSLPKGTLLF